MVLHFISQFTDSFIIVSTISVTAKTQNTFPHIFIVFLKVYNTHKHMGTHTHWYKIVDKWFFY